VTSVELRHHVTDAFIGVVDLEVVPCIGDHISTGDALYVVKDRVWFCASLGGASVRLLVAPRTADVPRDFLGGCKA